MARVTGLEPATSGVTGQRSNQLSYTRIICAPAGGLAPADGGLIKRTVMASQALSGLFFQQTARIGPFAFRLPGKVRFPAHGFGRRGGAFAQTGINGDHDKGGRQEEE